MTQTAKIRDSEAEIADAARVVVDVASSALASDVVLLDIRGVSDFADYFVIATASTPRHLTELAERIEVRLKSDGLPRTSREGKPEGGWVLIDFPGIVVHLFIQRARRFYDLEGLWSAATEVLRIQ